MKQLDSKVVAAVEAMGAVARQELDRLGLGQVEVKISWGHWATYFRATHRNSLEGSFVRFGTEMVQRQLDRHGLDKVRREMQGFKWDSRFGASPAMRMAMVICHEISHALVHRDGQRVRGVVHGREFYLRYRPLAEQRAEDLALGIAELAGEGLLDEPDPATEAVPRAPRRRLRSHAPRSGRIRPGIRVWFEHRGRRIQGSVKRWGKKRWTVIPEGEPNRKWHVPDHLLTPL